MKRFLRTLFCTGILATVAAAAQAQARVFVGVRAPIVVAAVPACPGVGYTWAPGYYAGAVWYPGRWVYRGYNRGYYARDYRYDYRHDYRFHDRDRNHDRGWDRR
jgi:hypothetical protein